MSDAKQVFVSMDLASGPDITAIKCPRCGLVAEALRANSSDVSVPGEAWQKMGTEPKDGKPVIIAQEGGGVGEAFYEDEHGHEGWYWAGSHWTDAYGGSVRGKVIAWQPLPEPPIHSALQSGNPSPDTGENE